MRDGAIDRLVLGDNRALYRRLAAIDAKVPQVFSELVSELESYDPGLLESWDREGMTPKVATYFLRYVLPFYELLRLGGVDQYCRLLVAQLLSCCAWRAFDNCVDGHVPYKEAHHLSLVAFGRLSDYVSCNWPVRAARDLRSHYDAMAEQAIRESVEPVPLEEIWKKCAVLVYAPESLARLDSRAVTFYKNYINYCGLSHDVADFVSDIACQVVSLPVKWFREADSNGVLTVAVVEAIYAGARAAVRPIEESGEEMILGGQLPLTTCLLKDASAVFGG